MALQYQMNLFLLRLLDQVLSRHNPDWNSPAKVRSDPEMQPLMARIRDNANPSAEPVTASIVEDVAI